MNLHFRILVLSCLKASFSIRLFSYQGSQYLSINSISYLAIVYLFFQIPPFDALFSKSIFSSLFTFTPIICCISNFIRFKSLIIIKVLQFS
jgi:hypothetical protein